MGDVWEDQDEQREPKKPELNLAGALAGGLAALTSAVLLSFTGTTGTIVGAALGSTVLTLGNSIYEYYLRRMAELRNLAHQRMLARVSRGERLIIPGEVVPKPRLREVLKRVPYRRVLLTTATLFVVVMTAIVGLEMAAGRSVAAMAGASNARTTVPLPGVEPTVATQPPAEPEVDPTPAEDPTDTHSPTQSPTQATSTPSQSPTATPSPQDSQDTPTPSVVETQTEEPLDDLVSPEPTLLEPSTTVPTMTDDTTTPAEEQQPDPNEEPRETEVETEEEAPQEQPQEGTSPQQ